MKKHLSIDIETRSSVDIGSAGLYKYAQSDDFSHLTLKSCCLLTWKKVLSGSLTWRRVNRSRNMS